MSVIIYGDEVYEIVKKKRKLETVEESVKRITLMVEERIFRIELLKVNLKHL